jgi:hypothetical protein
MVYKPFSPLNDAAMGLWNVAGILSDASGNFEHLELADPGQLQKIIATINMVQTMALDLEKLRIELINQHNDFVYNNDTQTKPTKYERNPK